jgi:hypothetical protein
MLACFPGNVLAQSSSIEQVLREKPPSFTVAGKEEGDKHYVASEGYAELTWRLGDSDEQAEQLQETIDSLPEAEKPAFELQQADAREFENPRTVYEGRDLASVISGLREGKYFFRVRGKSADGEVISPWSQVETIVVEYPAYQNFWGLPVLWWQLGGGFLVFLLTIGFLVFMSFRSLREGTGSHQWEESAKA